MARRKKKKQGNMLRVLDAVVILALAAAAVVTVLIFRGSFTAGSAKPSAPAVQAANLSAPTETAAPAATPEPVPEYYTVSMVGDCTLSASRDKIAWGIGFQMTVGDDYAYPFANTVQFLRDDYLTIANLECALSDRKYSSIEQFSFLGKAAYANILSEGSVEFVTLANNHTLDFGQEAYNDTAASLDAVGVAYAGEDECYVYQLNGGVKIGLYCMFNGLTGNNFNRLSASEQERLVAESRERLERAVRTLAESGAEYTIACLHMGVEGNYETTDVQVELCRYAIDAGFGSVYKHQPRQRYRPRLLRHRHRTPHALPPRGSGHAGQLRLHSLLHQQRPGSGKRRTRGQHPQQLSAYALCRGRKGLAAGHVHHRRHLRGCKLHRRQLLGHPRRHERLVRIS